jgi:hypothetical protein
MNKILECSSRGDKRFSAFYAYVEFNGIYANIETHYQACKKFNRPVTKPKGHKPDYIEINGKTFEIKYLTPFYKLLWVKYLDDHPELVGYASEFDDFHDMFKGKNTINCQADVIRQYVKDGRESIINEELVKELLSQI